MTLSWQGTLTVSAHFLHGMLHFVRTQHGEKVTAQVLASAAIPSLCSISLMHG
ncbi:hypothetical protein UNDKW_3320 [Undibacterium sp. KW1]|uniref:hypothetical protein n=1 Tax=Undibacterium sp. KW1 TaxID=2058624 RepID=UPI001331F8F0|nr:hypothetical protein [Undibacterium sp. KW1]BBB61593.1 hypothetical protein UNDKW_3320 [Undibacterium sp. KW1]